MLKCVVGLKLIITILTWFHNDIFINFFKGGFNLELSKIYFEFFQVAKLSIVLMNIFPMNPKLFFSTWFFKIIIICMPKLS